MIVVAAGTGVRIGTDTPKQYLMICEKPVLRHTLNVFSSLSNIQKICVVIHPDHEEMFSNAAKGLELTFCYGGAERSDSVRSGIAALGELSDDDIILIHDAARPFVKADDIQKLIQSMENHKAATLACPVIDTLQKSDGKTVPRDDVWFIQTPQAFHAGLIKQAHEKYKDEKLTDDTQYAALMGEEVHFVLSSRHNIKITVPEDLVLAEKLLNASYETRTGTGYDVHAFDEAAADKVRLCGVDVPHDKTLKGHSDADVGLHAITDALLGAIGEGDIGLHFPPSDDTFKNMDSAIFLEKANALLKGRDGKIINVDVTLICERPKLGAFRDTMRDRIAEILSISSERVNVKATTTEKLGFTGREEGIAAQAVVNVSLPAGNS
ncbi:MAG: bifunctional 2-C-methyl-D-erythritol 4-phosphate cytidylyltransferase/2-C-methyl-D-erythritol 2,4-cyclodiphosphate synthase [Alphaproteobacteria bacterium]|nr:bifunctional 2-C-methyl-D-erythritol 4-phosphate cytidylyltransferase/2-C-methyl-D-erythritol 2,4-cyclodiphosphate synthase [Alphaproteobacteria bacterium]